MPGKHYRLEGIAWGVGSFLFIFVRYTVDRDHSDASTPFVYRCESTQEKYTRLSDMPKPVGDTIVLDYQERYIYLVSGWHDNGNVNLVQFYDIKNNGTKPLPIQEVHFWSIQGYSGQQNDYC